jgi:hypothetical protein
VAQAVIVYMKDKDRVELPAAKLHDAIEKRVGDDLDLPFDKTWPKTGRTLWKRIREVTPLLEAHGIRAWRKNDNRSGRPIVLDTDFTDDNADDNYTADDNADDNLGGSSANAPHSNGKSDDNGSNGRYFRDSLAFHTSDPKEGHEQGESRPDLSSASSASPKGTAEQARRIEELLHRGFSEYAARVEVLAKGHPVGCECEVCG